MLRALAASRRHLSLRPASIRALRKLGVSETDMTIFLAGEPVAFRMPTAGGSPTIGILRTCTSHLESGIIDLYINPDARSGAPGTGRGAGARAIGEWRSISMELCRSLGIMQVELYGADIVNHDIMDMLARRQFIYGLREVPESLGGGEVEVLARIFPVKR
jgi:hypothetical protein